MAAQRYASPPAVSPEENALFRDILHEAPLFAHRKAARIVGSILYCIVLAGYATLAIGAPLIFRPLQGLISPVLCSCDFLLLLLTGIFQQYLVYQVQKIRLQGYYSFSQKLKYIVRIPFAITAYGTAAMLLVIVWKPYTSFMSISAILRIIMVVEAVCAGSFMSLYIRYIHQYNSLNSHPDVLKSLYSPLQPSSSLEGLRQTFCNLVSFLIYCMTPYLSIKKENIHSSNYNVCKCMMIYPLCISHVRSCYANSSKSHLQRANCKYKQIVGSLIVLLLNVNTVIRLFWCNRYHDGGRLSDQQMALLQYQRENLHFLSEEILRLQECLSKYERTDDRSTPQVDLANLLAARDQELRTLSAEMNQVQSELRLARSLIAERDSEIQRVRMTNNQYVEENDRLRAILGEWSTRAAKLERALEAERMSNLESQRKMSTLRNQSYASTEATE